MARHPQHFEREMDKLKKMTLALGTLVVENVDQAVKALVLHDSERALRIIDSDGKVDEKEVELEEECLKVLALYQPVANDLRLVVAILKINSDLERIGDLAVNIAERATFLSSCHDLDIPPQLNEMAEKTLWMLNTSLDSFVELDPVQAHRVCAADDEVDNLNRFMFDKFEDQLKQDTENLRPGLELLSASRYLERVADHATNICEDVIYLVGGQIVRHRKEVSLIPVDKLEKLHVRK